MSINHKSPTDKVLTILALLFFLIVIIYCKLTSFKYYIADSIIFMVLTIVLYILYKPLHLNTTTLFFLLLAFSLHDLGAFKFYANPPTPFDWDIVTHLFGIFAATLMLYNIVLSFHASKHHVAIFLIVLLAANGIGVVIEFVEFFGFMTTGFGEGFLGHGFGDYDPRVVSSDYIDTIQDLFWNTVGSVVGFIAAYALNQRKRVT